MSVPTKRKFSASERLDAREHKHKRGSRIVSKVKDLMNEINEDDLLSTLDDSDFAEWGQTLAVLKFSMPTIMYVIDVEAKLAPEIPENVRIFIGAEQTGLAVEYYKKVSRIVGACFSKELREKRDNEDGLVLAPPTSHCFECRRDDGSPHKLQMIQSVQQLTWVNHWDMNGPKKKRKLALRCPNCRIVYRYSMYGNANEGFRFYDRRRAAIEATDENVLDRKLVELH